jgi:signal transduction histidine kinase
VVRVTGSLPERSRPAPVSRHLDYAWLLLWLACAAALVLLPGWQAVLLATAFIAAAGYGCRRAAAGRQRRDIGVVVAELERLRVLSERLLLIAAAPDPGFLTPAATSLDKLVAEQVRRWLTQAAAPPGLALGRLDQVTAVVDAGRIGQALDALIENAVRHAGAGDEITVSVLREKEKEGRFARIVVQDSGAGIPPADVPHLFDQIPAGAGLGLTLVRAIARSHGGDAVVQSTLGSGSRFDLVLPGEIVQEAW